MDLTVGVEEEFVLTDTETRRVVRRAETVLAGAKGSIPAGSGVIEAEISPAQVEIASPVCTDLPTLRSELLRLRTETARAAQEHGCRLIASGTAVLGNAGPPPFFDKSRYHRIAERFGPLVDQLGTCSCHVHIGVPDRDEAIQVVNHLRPWLPTLLALSVNSPFWDGRDTGYQSWRTPLWARWPAAGPPPYLSSAEEYKSVVEGLRRTGAIIDEAMVHWYVRPSSHLPTVEVRIADVAPTVEEAVVMAALVRALVGTALIAIRAGRPAPQVHDHVLGAACWQAARYGLTSAVPGNSDPSHPIRGVAELLAHVRGVLEEFDDVGMVRTAVRALQRAGTGADRQRASYRRRGRLEDVIDDLAAQALFDPSDGPHGVRNC
ncbi:carboxylate-amine ligase [Nocardia goodfellowii]